MTVIRARRVVTPDGEVAADVALRDGVIEAVLPYGVTEADVVELPADEVLLPGLVDTHVHVNEPGRTEWEGFATATRAAAAGGVTTIVDMPLNSIPPTVNVAALAAKRAAAAGKVHVDVGFWGGIVPGNLPDVSALDEQGVFGFKSFLLDSGVPEFGHLDRAQLVAALAEVRRHGALLILHAEDDAVISAQPAPVGRHYRDFLSSRPRGAEDSAIGWVIEAARRTGARAHIVHLSSSDALPMIRAAREAGVALTVETCPHYLTLTAEQIPDGATQFKCCPPIREASNQDKLWAALGDGTIDCVVSDHSPCVPELKCADSGDFGKAWGGIAGLQLGLPAVWTAAHDRGHGLTDVARWMALRPAELVGLRHKGKIATGADADLCAFAPDETFTVDASTLRHRHPVTPYHGRTLRGVVRRTWLRGSEVDGGLPRGRLLRKGEP
jgi:allantoinase